MNRTTDSAAAGRSPVNPRAKSEADSGAIYVAIRESIAAGTLAPGAKLPPERELAERYGAARNTVRKTMKMLETEGTVVRQVGRGTFVVGVPGRGAGTAETDLGEIFEARLLFEPGFADLIVARADAGDFAEMDRCLEQIRRAEDWRTYKEWKYALHLAFAQATKNRFLVHVFQTIIESRARAGWDRLAGDLRAPSEAREAGYRANVEIVDALRDGDAERAGQLIRDYLQRMLRTVNEI